MPLEHKTTRANKPLQNRAGRETEGGKGKRDERDRKAQMERHNPSDHKIPKALGNQKFKKSSSWGFKQEGTKNKAGRDRTEK